MIYHLLLPADWEKALSTGIYRPASLKSEGFIHLSTYDQTIPTAEIYFTGFQELVVLELSEKKLKPKLKWEKSRDDQEFPHYYGSLPLELVENTRMLIRNRDGSWEWLS